MQEVCWTDATKISFFFIFRQSFLQKFHRKWIAITLDIQNDIHDSGTIIFFFLNNTTTKRATKVLREDNWLFFIYLFYFIYFLKYVLRTLQKFYGKTTDYFFFIYLFSLFFKICSYNATKVLRKDNWLFFLYLFYFLYFLKYVLRTLQKFYGKTTDYFFFFIIFFIF